MKLKYDFVINKVADKNVAVSVGTADFNGFIKMDDLGAFMLGLLKEEISEDEMAAKMKEQYPDNTLEEIKECIDDFTSKLKAEGVI